MMRAHVLPAMFSVMLVMACTTTVETAPVSETNAGHTEAESADNSHPLISILGIPTSFGSEPRTYVAIVLHDGEKRTNESYYVHPDHQDDLRGRTGELLRLEGHMYEGEESFFDARHHDGVFVPEKFGRQR